MIMTYTSASCNHLKTISSSRVAAYHTKSNPYYMLIAIQYLCIQYCTTAGMLWSSYMPPPSFHRKLFRRNVHCSLIHWVQFLKLLINCALEVIETRGLKNKQSKFGDCFTTIMKMWEKNVVEKYTTFNLENTA